MRMACSCAQQQHGSRTVPDQILPPAVALPVQRERRWLLLELLEPACWLGAAAQDTALSEGCVTHCVGGAYESGQLHKAVRRPWNGAGQVPCCFSDNWREHGRLESHPNGQAS